ncbi:hypothetical protein QJS10_CPA05g00810 [Acorus calamus]|uniref:Uncharacterized protein n=1 Tax=Acorus calamus TaxID=4465 RepID=A0AAV9ESR8_ACOCL|nr:hypothetical protein QJS10_CPA05g00810 [Acorus calamus]
MIPTRVVQSVAATGDDPSEEGYPPLVSQVDFRSGGKSEPIQEDKKVGIPVKAGRQSPSGFKPTKADRRKLKGRRKADDKRTENHLYSQVVPGPILISKLSNSGHQDYTSKLHILHQFLVNKGKLGVLSL